MENGLTALTDFGFEGNGVRVFGTPYDPWFVGKDVCDALGYSNPRDAIARHVDEDDKNTVVFRDGNRGNPNITIINESGLYALIFGSDLPEAKRFKRFVTHEVLPSIRKYGYYKAPKPVKALRPTRGRPPLALAEHVERQKKFVFENGERCDITDLRWISRELGIPLEQISDNRTSRMVEFINEQMAIHGIESITDIRKESGTVMYDEPDETYAITVDGVLMEFVR